MGTVEITNLKPKDNVIQQQIFGYKYDNKTRSMPRYSKLNKISSSDFLNDNKEQINQRKLDARTMKNCRSENNRYRNN